MFDVGLVFPQQSDDMARFAHETALKAFETCTKEREIASFIQAEFNKAFGYACFFHRF
jgi:hypothetical protein